jgi:hypothetical protein
MDVMADRYRAPGGWTVDVIHLSSTPDHRDGEWLRVSFHGAHVPDVRTVAELEQWFPLADLAPETLAPCRQAAHGLTGFGPVMPALRGRMLRARPIPPPLRRSRPRPGRAIDADRPGDQAGARRRRAALSELDGRRSAAATCCHGHDRAQARALLGETCLPLGTTAYKQGRVAGENALGGTKVFAGSLGTQVVKVFEHAAARSGLRNRW